jgi:DNA polymerase-3 subunit alpha
LIGLYVSDHPLSPYLNALRGKITHFSSELGEAANKEPVTVAGLVSKMRTLTTKTGKPMAFVTIEDLQGPIELVIFPKTWSKCSGIVHQDGILLAEGKVDAESADPKVLVDSVKGLSEADLKTTNSAEDTSKAYESRGSYQSAVNNRPVADRTSQARVTKDTPSDEPPMPPEPDDWHLMVHPGDDSSILFSPESEVEISEPQEFISDPNLFVSKGENIPAVVLSEPIIEAAPKTIERDPIGRMPPLIINPRVYDPQYHGEKNDSHMVTIILRSSGDKERDVRRLKRIHGLLRSCPGSDHFCFLIFENGHRHFLDFPNDTTGANQTLIDQLTDLVGVENVQIESIKLQ